MEEKNGGLAWDSRDVRNKGNQWVGKIITGATKRESEHYER